MLIQHQPESPLRSRQNTPSSELFTLREAAYAIDDRWLRSCPYAFVERGGVCGAFVGEAVMAQETERGHRARRQVCCSGVSAIAVEVFVNNTGQISQGFTPLRPIHGKNMGFHFPTRRRYR